MENGGTSLTTALRDRATGLIVGMAVGDALGAGYEFEPREEPHRIRMKGGGLGPFAPGEWTDDTSMAMPLFDALVAGEDLLDVSTQDGVAQRWVKWAQTAPDVGTTTRQVLSRYDPAVGAASLAEAAAQMRDRGWACAGNGSLMRTAPIVLGYLDDSQGLATAARRYSDLTHGDPDASDACVLWTQAQRHAILHAEFDIHSGLARLPRGRRELWAERIDEAQQQPASSFSKNGWVVGAFQAAWSAIFHARCGGPEHFEEALRAAVAVGHDTDTVAAIAGGLLGAKWGVSAIPLAWRSDLHGWPGRRDQDLVQGVWSILSQRPWPATFNAPSAVQTVPHPSDPGVWLGGVSGLRALPASVDAVVSLCRLGSQQTPSAKLAVHDHVWLVDSSDTAQNPHLEFVVREVVGHIQRLRAQGHTVYLHCVEARSRTPLVAALYGAAVSGRTPEEELSLIQAVMKNASPNWRFTELLARQTNPGGSCVDGRGLS